MRLRLYRLDGDSSRKSKHRPLLIDRFPVSIGDPAEWTPANGNSFGLHECCEIDQIGDTLFVTDTSPDESTKVNGRRVSVAPMLPGDRITLNTTEFLVSYERMTSAPPPPAEFVFQHSASSSEPLDSSELRAAHTGNDGRYRSTTSRKLPADVLKQASRENLDSILNLAPD